MLSKKAPHILSAALATAVPNLAHAAEDGSALEVRSAVNAVLEGNNIDTSEFQGQPSAALVPPIRNFIANIPLNSPFDKEELAKNDDQKPLTPKPLPSTSVPIRQENQEDRGFSRLMSSPWYIGGVAEVGGGYDFNRPQDGVSRGDAVQPKNGSPGLNLGVLQIYNEPVQGKLSPLVDVAFQAGSAAEALYASVSRDIARGFWTHIAKANVGFQAQNGLKFQLGIMPPTIGLGAHWGWQAWNRTGSYQSNATPYYVAGGKLEYPIKNTKLDFSVVNGWDIAGKPNNAPSFIFGYSNQAVDNLNLSQHLFVGPEQDDLRPKTWRAYLNNQVIYNHEVFDAAAFVDLGVEASNLPEPTRNFWFNAGALARLKVIPGTWSIAGRQEIFYDPQGHIFGAPQNLLTGTTVSSDFAVGPNAFVRFEGRYNTSTAPEGYFYNVEGITPNSPGLRENQLTIGASLYIPFSQNLGK